MMWKEVMRKLATAFERTPGLLNSTAMVRQGDVLYELDLFRSLQSGRLHISAAYPENPDDIPDFDEVEIAASLAPEEQPEATAKPQEEEIPEGEPVDIHPTSFSGKRK